MYTVIHIKYVCVNKIPPQLVLNQNLYKLHRQCVNSPLYSTCQLIYSDLKSLPRLTQES